MADEKTNDEDRVAPVSLPAGSFDAQELKVALDKATSVKNRDEHPERINKAIVDTIAQPDILANADAPAIPTGASIVEQDYVAREGDEPVKRQGLAFDKVDAESGAEAAEMRYDARSGDAVDASVPIVETADGDAPATLGEQARERVESPQSATARTRAREDK